MEFDKIHNKGQARLFKNKYVEYLTKTHPLVIWGLYLPILIYFPYHAYKDLNFSLIHILLILCAGIFFWSFFEYMMHRYIFHWVSENKKVQRAIYVLHGNHHHFPRDKARLFMPPVPSIIAACILFSSMYFVLRNSAFVFFPAFILGYLVYGSMHYAIHTWRPPFNWLKPLWRNHHLHHYKDHEKGFGVSTNLWDRVFGTFSNPNEENESVKGAINKTRRVSNV